MLAFIVQFFFVIIVGVFCIYTYLEWHHAKANKKSYKIDEILPTASMDDPELPTVSVLLPIYNEEAVLERIIKSACDLRYPLSKLDIWVLDDSPHGGSKQALELVKSYASKGISIFYAKRTSKRGSKAGNLAFGLTKCRGELISIFDADYIPPPDFLLKTVPYFAKKRMGFLQTSIDYGNKEHSFLTRFQAMMSGHKENITKGQEKNNHVASLTGSSCIWRRECIEDIGGIKSATICEDIDMGMRAQINNWKYSFITHVVSLAELPESMAVFRVQRERWARGHIQNSLRHAHKIFALVNMSIWARIQALVLLFAAVLLASFYIILLLALPVVFLTDDLGVFFNLTCTVFLISTILWVYGCMRNSTPASTSEHKQKHFLRYSLGYVLMFFPFSLYYFYALCSVLIKWQGNFNRTPKGKSASAHPALNGRLLFLEIFSFNYALLSIVLGIAYANYWVCLYGALACGGFGLGLYLSWRDTQKITANSPKKHIFITGASGAIGQALALEYAAPEMQLTLHGRDAKRLENLAKQCEDKGATVHISTYDLSDIENIPSWIADVCAPSVPDLCVANAGLIYPIDKQKNYENIEETQALWQVNILANITLMDSMVAQMRQNGHGHIVIISSLASYFGLPTAPSYCASKAALRVYGDALHNLLKPEGIRVTTIMPGSIESHMVDVIGRFFGLVLTPQQGARHIVRGIAKNKARLLFPFPLSIGCWSLSILPHWIALPIVRWLSRVL